MTATVRRQRADRKQTDKQKRQRAERPTRRRHTETGVSPLLLCRYAGIPVRGMPRAVSKGCGVRGVVAQRSAGIRAEQGGVNAPKGPFAARRTTFAAQGRHPPAGHACGAYGRKKGGQRKTAARLFGTRQGSKAPRRNGPTRDLLPGTGKVNAARRRARRGCACT